jgi:hypothetical protein
MHLALFNMFEAASRRYTVVASLAIETFIVLHTGGVHPHIRRALLICCQIISKKSLKKKN